MLRIENSGRIYTEKALSERERENNTVTVLNA
jgi:hypothetical protein